MKASFILRSIFGAFLGVLSFTLATDGSAQQANPGLGRLSKFLPETGQDNTWRFVNANNSFEIQNVGDPNAITYFYAGPERGTEGRRTIEAAVNIHPDSRGSAGLLYGLDQDRGVYHMLTLNADGLVTLFRRDNGGFRPMLEQTSSSYDPGKMNTLRIQENRDEITLFLNGTSLGSVGGDLYGFGGTGIGAVGDVRAFFNMYSDGGGSDRGTLQQPDNTGRTQTAQAPGDSLQVRPLQIMDQQGPARQPVVAYQTMIPADWKTEGGVQWNANDGQGQCFTGARLIWRAMSQDEAYSVAYLDPVSWGVTSAGPARYRCLQTDLPDAQSVMKAYLQIISQALQQQGVTVEVLEYLKPPELRPIIDAFAQRWRSDTPGSQAWTDGVVVRTRIVALGRPLDGLIFAVTNHLAFNGSGGSFRAGQSALILGLTTPQGKLEQGHPGFGVILNNLRPNPQWLQIENQWWQQKVAELGGTINGQIAAANQGKSIGDSMFESWKRRQGMQDAGHAKTVNGIWEVQPWKTPSGQTVLLNQNYKYAWQLQNGPIVLTNNANFNPMQAANQPGQQMQQGF